MNMKTYLHVSICASMRAVTVKPTCLTTAEWSGPVALPCPGVASEIVQQYKEAISQSACFWSRVSDYFYKNDVDVVTQQAQGCKDKLAVRMMGSHRLWGILSSPRVPPVRHKPQNPRPAV